MLHRIAEPLGNLDDFPVGSRALERVPVSSHAMSRRVLRLPTSAGDLGLMFEDERRLRDGDVLFADGERVIAIEVIADDVLVAYPATIGAAVELAHALGNRHVPIQRDGDAIVIGYAAALEDVIARSGVPYERVARVLERPFVHASAPHEHA